MSGGGGSVGEEDANVEAGHLREKQDNCSLLWVWCDGLICFCLLTDVWCGYVVSTEPGPSAEEVGHMLLQVSVWQIIAFVNLFDEATATPISRSYHILKSC